MIEYSQYSCTSIIVLLLILAVTPSQQGRCADKGWDSGWCNMSCQAAYRKQLEDCGSICYCSYDCHDEKNNDCCDDACPPLGTKNLQLMPEDACPCEGIVQVKLDPNNEEWGGIDGSDNWRHEHQNAANVICKQLEIKYTLSNVGTGNALVPAPYTSDKSAEMPILMRDVTCDNSYIQSIQDCSYTALPQDQQSTDKTFAGVMCCPQCTNGDMKLDPDSPCIYDGSGRKRSVYNVPSSEGIYYTCNGRIWSLICSDSFSQYEANLACSSVYPNLPVGMIIPSTNFTYVNRSIYDMNCIGCETHISQCFMSPHPSCTNVLALGCYPSPSYEGQPTLLPEGSNKGRLLVYNNGAWATVCKNGFGMNEAKVVCSELGYNGSHRIYRNKQFGAGYGDILQVSCNGNETHINQCSLSQTNTCTHDSDIGIECEEGCSFDGQLRLVDGKGLDFQGRVEICRNNVWGTICADSTTTLTWSVKTICHMLNKPSAGAISYNFGPGADPVHYFLCSNSSILPQTNPFCTSHMNDLGVVCQSCTPGEVRLVNGSSSITGELKLVNGSSSISIEGRLEVCNGAQEWNTVCELGWYTANARVVCYQLGYTRCANVRSFGGSRFGIGTGQMNHGYINCTGSESKLTQCPVVANISGRHCNPRTNVVGLRCEGIRSGNQTGQCTVPQTCNPPQTNLTPSTTPTGPINALMPQSAWSGTDSYTELGVIILSVVIIVAIILICVTVLLVMVCFRKRKRSLPTNNRSVGYSREDDKVQLNVENN